MADTDQELLKLAAKAVGAKMTEYSDKTPDHWLLPNEHGYWVKWDPLASDAQAFRLAVKLGISPEWGGFDIEVCRKHSGARNFCYVEPHGDDPYAATRRAIVRAAAEIGRAM